VRNTAIKTPEEYLKRPYRLELVAVPDEGDYVASYPELTGCITCGETVENAIANAKDAKSLAGSRHGRRTFHSQL
jgi:hypothetical protein